MNPNKEKSLKAMRTFARDLDRERGDTKTAEETVVPKKPVAPKKEVKKKETPAPPKKEKKQPKKKEIKKEHIVADTPKKDEPKHIPAFHELQKTVSAEVKKTEPTPPVKKSKRKGIEPTKAVAGGTIITDTKKAKPSFFGEFSASLQRWFTNVQKALKPKGGNTYAVSKTDRRKGVVQKATSKTGTIFSADSETLKEQIKARQKAEKHGDDNKLNWSPFTEPGFDLIEDEEVESSDERVEKVVVSYKKHVAPKPKPVIKSTEKIAELREPEPIKIPEPEPEPVPIPPPVPEPEPVTPAEVPEPEVEVEPEITPEPVTVVEEQPFLPIESEEETPEYPSEEESELTTESADSFTIRNISINDTNTLALILLGVVLGIGIIVFMLYSVLNIGAANETGVTPPAVTVLYPGAAESTIVLEDGSFNELLTKTNTAAIESYSDGLMEFSYKSITGDTVAPATLMRVIQTAANDGFADAVTDVRFVKTSDNQRAVVLGVGDTTTARGGMLNWEETLLGDVRKLLDIPDTPPNAGEFTDTQFGALDVRALILGNQTILVYTITDTEQVIIANNISVLAALNQN